MSITLWKTCVLAVDKLIFKKLSRLITNNSQSYQPGVFGLKHLNIVVRLKFGRKML